MTVIANVTAFNLDAELSRDNDDEDIMVLAGDYYFNPAFSVGLSLGESDADGVDSAYAIGIRYFFTPAGSGGPECMDDNATDIIWRV